MNPDDLIRLQHIVDALSKVTRFIEGRSRVDLVQDDLLSFALMHAIQIVGEAASKITPETRDRLRQIPWADIVGMRHRLVHAYVDIDHDVLWFTATEAAPRLLAQMKTILDAD